jgi:DNA-binding response OmpR family regulator
MGGPALYHRLQERLPGVKVLFVTGHPLDAENQALLEKGRVHWLQKPFSVREFALTLRELLS